MYDRYLELFIRVADCGSFSKAAQQLFISPNAVMKQINSFESHLGFPLFTRSRRGLSLTEEGQVIYAEGRRIIRKSERILHELRSRHNTPRHVVRIGNSLLFPSRNILVLWPKALEYCPDLELKIVPFSETEELYISADNHLWNEFDIMCVNFGNERSKEELAQLQLEERRLCIGVPLRHPLARADLIRIEDLHGERLMVVHKGLSHYIDAVREELTLHHPEVTIVDVPVYDANTFNRCVNENLLMLSVKEWDGIHPSVINVPADWDFRVPYGLMYRRDAPPDIQRFVHAIQKAVAEDASA